MLYTLICLVCFMAIPANDPNWAKIAASEKDPQRLIRLTMDRTMAILQSRELDLPVKQARIVDIVTTVLDVDVMARLTLSTHWQRMTQQQQQRFTGLFLELLKATYLGKLADYNDQKIEIGPGKVVDRRAQVPTELVSRDKRIPIIYKLHLADQRWRVYDVEIDGVSIVMTYRAQFQDVLAKGTIEDLLTKLQDRTKDPNQPRGG
ncbi:MAG: ABC transporter substrate-binding protein [Sedimentisphaerales bacterium]|nr:ABC transporter substrate-binding protein [Sedimentisphaerales bacterium]